MRVTSEAMLSWTQAILGVNPVEPKRPLGDYLAAIPRLDSLANVPSGTSVLVRGDVDAKPGKTVGEKDVRLRSMAATLQFGRQRGWKQVVFGHIGRKPEESLANVAARLGEILGCAVPLVTDWLDESALAVKPAAVDVVRAAAPGAVLVLQNARQYKIERVLWDAQPADLPKLAEPLGKLASALATQIASVYVNEAFSAGSLDSSTTVVPAAMDRVALGKYVAGEFDGPMRRCLAAQLVVFSGLKIDKLDDLQAMIDRGTVQVVFVAGSLAMALKKAAAALDGGQFSLGVAEDPAHADKPYYIPRERIDQARGMLTAGRAKGIEFVLPVDFVLADGQPSATIGPGQQQFDVGPRTAEFFAQKVGQFIERQQGRGGVAFFNGVFGMFEDSRFQAGTKAFIAQLRRMKEAGVEVYVGGGEGGTALEMFGRPDDVTHSFTAGGTVLNALGSQPVPYLVALAMAARRTAT